MHALVREACGAHDNIPTADEVNYSLTVMNALFMEAVSSMRRDCFCKFREVILTLIIVSIFTLIIAFVFLEGHCDR